MPSAVMARVCTGRLMPSTSDGVTSWASSLPRNETPRAFSHGATDAWYPASFCGTFHGPIFSRRAQRPVRRKMASPGPIFTFANLSHASRSSTKTGVPGSSHGRCFIRGMSISTPRVTTPLRRLSTLSCVQPFSVRTSARAWPL